MENAVDAMKMGFAMMVFVMAMTATVYLFTQAVSTSQLLLYMADETNYFDNIEVEDITTREVGLDTVIPTLYRYYKENFAVQIYDEADNLVQIFDLNIEGKIRKAAGKTLTAMTDEQRALVSLYGKTNDGLTPADNRKNPYLYEASWIGDTNKDIKKRIDLYVGGGCAYIGKSKVDYTYNNLNRFKDSAGKALFTEEFIQYAYKGDTISSDDGTETITGNVKPETKIVIIYKYKP